MSLPRSLNARLDEQFEGEKKFGTAAGPGKGPVRRFMQRALKLGVSQFLVSQILNPAAYRGMNDPDGGGGMIDDVVTLEGITEILEYSKTCEGSGIKDGGTTAAQENFFNGVEGMREKYIALAKDAEAVTEDE